MLYDALRSTDAVKLGYKPASPRPQAPIKTSLLKTEMLSNKNAIRVDVTTASRIANTKKQNQSFAYIFEEKSHFILELSNSRLFT